MPYVGAATIPLFGWAFIASSLEDTTLADACKDAETAVRDELDGDDLAWLGDYNSDSLRGYRVTATEDGHLVEGGVDWTDAAGARKRTTFEVRISEEQTPRVAFASELTVRPAPTPTPEPTRTPAATPEPAPEGSGIGDLIRVGSLDLTILNVERYDAGLYIDANVRLHIEAVNARGTDDAEYNLSAYFFKLVDSNGIAYEPYPLLCASSCPDQVGEVYLVRGGRVRGFVYFEIPAGSQLVEVIYEPLFSFNKARVSLASAMVQAATPTVTPSLAEEAPASGSSTAGARAALPDRTPTAVPGGCTAEAAAARITGSVARIRTFTGVGTAFYIGDSTWLTAAHVVAGETSVRLTNDAIDINATVAKTYLEYDLAVLVGAASVSAIHWGETPRSGAEALVIGYGRGQRTLVAGVTRGIVSERFVENGETFIRTDAPANPGNSGGPLLNICGQVIGIVQEKLVGASIEGVTYALSADSVRAILR